MVFQVPGDWEIDGFGSYLPEEWDDGGSAVCECTGIILADPGSDLIMVFYPSLPEHLENEKHLKIGNKEYLTTPVHENLAIGKLTFKKEVSKFKDNDKLEVWKYTTTTNKYGYLVYFYGSPESMRQIDIQQIMETFKKSRKLKLTTK
jgi:hypothetical protein